MAFSVSGDQVAIETHWVDEGPGFPNAKVELRQVASGTLLNSWSARLTEGDALAGFEGASLRVRADAAAALSAAGVDLTRPATLHPCADGVCAPPNPASGCARSRDTVRVTVTSTPTEAKVDQCYGRGKAELLTLIVQGRTWVSESTPADGCPAAYTARAAWLQGDNAVLLLTHTIPGHEGRVARPLARTGRIR